MNLRIAKKVGRNPYRYHISQWVQAERRLRKAGRVSRRLRSMLVLRAESRRMRGFPLREHDDMVDAVTYAWSALVGRAPRRPRTPMIVIDDPYNLNEEART